MNGASSSRCSAALQLGRSRRVRSRREATRDRPAQRWSMTTGVFAAFHDGLRELGWIEGKNLLIERRSAENRIERLPDLAAELVRLNVDVIVGFGTPPPLAAKRATTTIPIVMAAAGDPVGSGLVASLARPGGNVTGMSLMAPDLGGKRSNCSRSWSLGSLAWPSFGMRPTRIPRSSSKRRRPRVGHWGLRCNPWRCEARTTSTAHSRLQGDSAPRH